MWLLSIFLFLYTIFVCVGAINNFVTRTDIEVLCDAIFEMGRRCRCVCIKILGYMHIVKKVVARLLRGDPGKCRCSRVVVLQACGPDPENNEPLMSIRLSEAAIARRTVDPFDINTIELPWEKHTQEGEDEEEEQRVHGDVFMLCYYQCEEEHVWLSTLPTDESFPGTAIVERMRRDYLADGGRGRMEMPGGLLQAVLTHQGVDINVTSYFKALRGPKWLRHELKHMKVQHILLATTYWCSNALLETKHISKLHPANSKITFTYLDSANKALRTKTVGVEEYDEPFALFWC